MKPLLKPPRLEPGDTVGIVSPSWCGAGLFPQRLQRGVRQLEAMGFVVKLAPHALDRDGYIAGTPADRAADLHAMFADPTVQAIIAAIGGDHSCQLLPLLDFDLIGRTPKIFLGYSDITVLNVALHQQTGLVTCNGPALLPDFGEFPGMLAYTEASFRRTVCSATPVGRIEPAPQWTEEFLDWGQEPENLRARAMQPSPGWTWLKPGYAAGPLLGGCLESLQHLRGTPYWPDFTGALFFWETSEERPSPAVVDGILMDYENMGVLDRITGMLVGRPMGYSPAERADLHRVLLERTARFDFPIIADMDFGHTAPQFTLPLGCRAVIDGERMEFAIVESAVL